MQECFVRILISAGEASGEMYGAQLIAALRRLDPGVVCFGAGGERMRAAGCDIVVDSRDLAVVGITEILGHLPKIWGLYRRLIGEAAKRKPEVAVVIDSPAFNWRVARAMTRMGVPVVYYVCPQFWAWRQGRVRLLRRYVDKGLVIFPFEEKFYRDRGVDAEFVGHPLADLAKPAIRREDYAVEHGLDPAKHWIVLMPGSRRKEVQMNLPEILQSARLLGADHEYLLPVAPTLNREFLSGIVGRSGIHLVPEALPALLHARAGIVASGTATVEAALIGMPFVMVYRVSPLTYLLGKSRVKVPFFAMVNLIAGEQVVPELIQQDFTAARAVGHLREIIADGPARERQIAGLNRVRRLLRSGKQGQSAAERAAEVALELAGRAPNSC